MSVTQIEDGAMPAVDHEAAVRFFALNLVTAEHDAPEWRIYRSSPPTLRAEVLRYMAAMPRTRAVRRAIEAAEWAHAWQQRRGE